MDRQSMGERYLQIYRSAGRERKNRLEGTRFMGGRRDQQGQQEGNSDEERMNQMRL